MRVTGIPYRGMFVRWWCLNDEISKGKAYNLDEIEGIQKFIESLPGEVKQNIVKL